MPILISLLFGLHDIFRMARYQDQTNFVAHEIIQMIQNVSQERTNKKVTRRDLGDICRFASYSIYPGKTVYCTAGAGRPYSHFYTHCPLVNFFCVKGESGGKASCVWKAHWNSIYGLYESPDADSTPHRVTLGYSFRTCVYEKQNATPSSIYPTLTINEGEIKIIVEVCIHHNMLMKYPDGTKTASVKQAFGLYLLTPIFQRSHLTAGYFHSVAIFTPKRGLFDDNGPQ